MKKLLPLLITAMLGAVPAAQAAPVGTGELPFAGVHGGALQDPVVDGTRVHVPSGRIVSTWDYTDPAAPVLLGSTAMTPADGQIRGLTKWGDHLYASWQAGDDTGGVAVYTLGSDGVPVLANQFSDYTFSSYKNLWTLAAANGYLYIFDAENGIYFGDLAANPLHPTFTRLLRTPVPYARSQVAGNRIFVTGKTVSSEPVHVCTMLDVTTPSAPQFILASDCGNGDQIDNFRSRVQLPYVAAFGAKFSLYDVTDPQATQALGRIDTDAATDGFLFGNYAYGLGFAEIAIHDIGNPMVPVTVGYSPIMTLGADSVTPVEDGALVLTSTDRFVRLDVSKDPLSPMETSVATPTGGAVARDIVLRGNKALILQENYGIGVADKVTFAPLERFDAALPMALNQRDFEQFAVDGDRAYLAAWGYGLIVTHIASERPYELGRIEFPYASAIAAKGNFVYLGTMTNGGILQVVDVSIPEKPTLRGSLAVPGVNRVQVHGHHVYIADELAGVHVVDVSDPDAPTRVTTWNDGCADPGGYSARDIELDAQGAIAAVGCPTGLYLLDLSRPDSPTRLGGHAAEWADARVAIHGDRAWYADAAGGLKAFDISSPATPVLVGEASLAGFVPRRLRATGDGRVVAFGTLSGMHVFGTIVPEVPTDRIFADGFDEIVPVGDVSTYDDLVEGFQGASFQYGGVGYREVNEVSGVYPDGEVFGPGTGNNALGNQFIVEDATALFADFPQFGSSPNTLTFGDSFVEGPNLSIGALSSAWLDLDAPATSASLQMLYYEWGPWEGIVLHVDALLDGVVVASDSLTIAGSGNPLDRDRLATTTFTVDGATFDTLHIYARWGNEYTAPRVMIDNLVIAPAR
ncbi:LVIVD repeat-containing protein [Dokdonella sp. MW10]|uniref:LVIVD repeat-containing protein n=1 Tax=Dokdonella sp. MW10 TaxID=2992926 RepID=UPI003F7F0A72